jgi:hypothetical protein
MRARWWVEGRKASSDLFRLALLRTWYGLRLLKGSEGSETACYDTSVRLSRCKEVVVIV